MKVFVYGSLRKGLNNHDVLGDSKFVGACRLSGGFTMYDLGPFPALLKGGDYKPYGEVYSVDDATLKRLDILEGVPHFYNRKKFSTKYGTAWVYYMTDESQVKGDPIVQSGDWVKHIGEY